MKNNIWTKEENIFWKQIRKPSDIQDFLNNASYNTDEITRSPRYVIKTNKAHCFDGALFGACALRQLGHKPLIIDLRAEKDDDHVLAVYKEFNCWGSVGKSNFTTLKYREPVYRTIRELVMSYFDFYFNSEGYKSLREYSRPLDLTKFDKIDWMRTTDDVSYIGEFLDDIKHYKIISNLMRKNLAVTDKNLLKAGLIGSDPKGLYKP